MRSLHLFVLCFFPIGLTAQSAHSLFPEAVGSTWTYNVEITLSDTSTQSATRLDVLTAVENSDGKRFLSIISTAGGLQSFELSQDTVKASLNVALPLVGLLPLDDLTQQVLDFELPQTTLFVSTAALNVRNEVNQFRQRIPTPQEIRDAIEQDAGIFSVTLSDSMDVVISQGYRRIADETITVPAGIYDTHVFQSLLGINVEIEARTILGRLKLIIPLLEDYTVTSWYAPSTGLIRQKAVPRELRIDENLVPVDVDFDDVSIPGFDMVLTSFIVGTGTSTPEGNAIPHSFSLKPNYPNPFNPSTVIPFNLTGSAYVKLDVYDLTGRRIKSLADGYFQAGQHTLNFIAAADLASGMYIYTLTIRDESGQITRLSQSMLLLK